MNWLISGLNNELKSHIILNRPETFEDAESLASLKDVVNRSTNAVKTGSQISNNKLIHQLHDLLNEKKNQPPKHQKEQAVASNNNVNVLPYSKANLNFSWEQLVGQPHRASLSWQDWTIEVEQAMMAMSWKKK